MKLRHSEHILMTLQNIKNIKGNNAYYMRH